MLRLAVAVMVDDDVCVAPALPLALIDTVGVGEPVRLGVPVPVEVRLAVAVPVLDPVPLPVPLLVLLLVPVCVPVAVLLVVALGDAVSDEVALLLAVSLAVSLAEGVMEMVGVGEATSAVTLVGQPTYSPRELALNRQLRMLCRLNWPPVLAVNPTHADLKPPKNVLRLRPPGRGRGTNSCVAGLTPTDSMVRSHRAPVDGTADAEDAGLYVRVAYQMPPCSKNRRPTRLTGAGLAVSIVPFTASPTTGLLPAMLVSVMLLLKVSITSAIEGRMPSSASDSPLVPSARTSLTSRCSTNVKPSAMRPA